MVRRLSQNSSQEIAASLWDDTAQDSFKYGQISGQEFLRKQESQAEAIQNQQIRNELKAINNSVKESIQAVTLSKQPENIGGLYNSDQEIHLNQNLFEFSKRRKNQSIANSIKETQERIKHIFNHEAQHAEHNDHKQLQIPVDGLLLGGIKLTATEFTEGINMAFTGTHSETGKKVVSLGYIRTHQKFQKAISNSDVTLIEAQEALKSRNIVGLDDRFRNYLAL